MAKHLAIFQPPYLELILSGVKTIDGRFSKKKTPPFGLVQGGDLVVMKESGGLIYGEFTVQEVQRFEHLSSEQFEALRQTYGYPLALSPEFWKHCQDSKFVTLMFIRQPVRYAKPFFFHKKDRRSWMLLEEDLLRIPA